MYIAMVYDITVPVVYAADWGLSAFHKLISGHK